MPKYKARVNVVDTGEYLERDDEGHRLSGVRNFSFWITLPPKDAAERRLTHRWGSLQVLSWPGKGNNDPLIFLLQRAIEQAYSRGFIDGCMDWSEEDLKEVDRDS